MLIVIVLNTVNGETNMGIYSHILLGLDLSQDSDLVATKGANLAKLNDATLSMVHVIEPLSFAYGGDIPMDFSTVQDEIYQQANQQLQRFAESSGIDDHHRHIVMGRPEVEIHAKAEEVSADLIVVGSH